MATLTAVQGTELVANRLAEQINFDVETLGAENLTPEWFNKMLDVVIESFNISFESATAEGFFKSAVSRTMNREAYRIVFPEMGMDENGNYTTNSNLWA